MTFFIVLTVLELCLMTKFARLGPSALHLGRYHFEKKDKLEGGQ
jgi:cytochrome d ubiquinol oxidase subunit I